MIKLKTIFVPLVLLVVGACASSSTTRLAQNVVRIDVSTAPVCGSSGARKIVNRLAAVETLRLGYDKYLISAMDSEKNVRVVGYTNNTNGTFDTYGNTTTYSGSTYSTPIIAGTRDAAIVAVMYKKR